MVASPTTGRFTPLQVIVLGITLRRLQDREAAQPSAPVQVPPVQLPSIAGSLRDANADAVTDRVTNGDGDRNRLADT